MNSKVTFTLWNQFAVEKKEIQPSAIRPIILDSWKRSRQVGVDPFRTGCLSVSGEEIDRRKKARSDLREATVPYIDNIYRIIKGSGSLITLTDEDGVVLDVLSDDDVRGMENFPHPERFIRRRSSARAASAPPCSPASRCRSWRRSIGFGTTTTGRAAPAPSAGTAVSSAVSASPARPQRRTSIPSA